MSRLQTHSRLSQRKNGSQKAKLASYRVHSIIGSAFVLSIVLLVVSTSTRSVEAMQTGNEQAAASETADADSKQASSSASANESTTKIIGSKSLLQVFQNGGPLMFPIGICSFVLMVFVFERAISLRRGRIIPRPFVKRILEQLRDNELTRDEAIALCQKNGSSVAVVFEAALQRWDRPTVEVEQAIIDSGERVTNGLRRYLRLINGIATVCPLLGLLGTVLGMIHAFDAIALTETQARPEVTIATGISQALLTTAAGLSVAIPALIAYLFFVGRVDRLVVEIDALGQRIVNVIASDAYRPAETESASKSQPKSEGKKRRAA